MSSGGSDIEIQSALPKKSTKKMPKSPSEGLLKKKQEKKKIRPQKEDPKKLSTKIMIHQALIDLKSRKGVSLQAIKKYLTEKYNVDTEKINYLIKKYIKKAVDEGTIIQTKGIGASGSFKLVPQKEKKAKPKKKKVEKEVKEKTKKIDKPKKIKETVEVVKSKTKPEEKKTKEKPKKVKKVLKEQIPTSKQVKKTTVKTKKPKLAKALQTPAKKRAAMMKRKSIGSIIKAPKMRPKAKA